MAFRLLLHFLLLIPFNDSWLLGLWMEDLSGSHFIYVGDEHGLFSVIKFDAEEGQLLKSSNHLSAKFLREAAGFPESSDQPIIGILSQPYSSGNRLLIAFQDGLLILWDVSEAKIVFLGGGKDLELKDDGGNTSEMGTNLPADILEQNLGDKEISALCWPSSDGSILAVGYLDGDILFWNLSSAAPSKGQQTTSSKNVVWLQLLNAERRIPVIVLQWSNNHKSHNDCTGQLFVYSGDEIGSEEVLTVLTLEWSSGIESLRCIGRADLTLNGTFADLILLPSLGERDLNSKDDHFVLTNPGQIHYYDNDSLSALLSQQSRTSSVSAQEFPVLIPMADPSLTVAKLIKLPSQLNSSKTLAEVASILKTSTKPGLASFANWPLTGVFLATCPLLKFVTETKIEVHDTTLGKGPLMRASLQASEEAGQHAKEIMETFIDGTSPFTKIASVQVENIKLQGIESQLTVARNEVARLNIELEHNTPGLWC
ncbi:hypothetical protein KIW84_055656 [Lathyrus oleraceus]|uniref:Transducin family protein / WD-40 repeat family protein n=1 Tax=Pisum sativum TaxID=3888 RepID=A0A9D5AK79_PEA|nr:hypothetical protein KIW84_055656 [Pisum sativum]